MHLCGLYTKLTLILALTPCLAPYMKSYSWWNKSFVSHIANHLHNITNIWGAYRYSRRQKSPHIFSHNGTKAKRCTPTFRSLQLLISGKVITIMITLHNTPTNSGCLSLSNNILVFVNLNSNVIIWMQIIFYMLMNVLINLQVYERCRCGGYSFWQSNKCTCCPI